MEQDGGGLGWLHGARRRGVRVASWSKTGGGGGLGWLLGARRRGVRVASWSKTEGG